MLHTMKTFFLLFVVLHVNNATDVCENEDTIQLLASHSRFQELVTDLKQLIFEFEPRIEGKRQFSCMYSYVSIKFYECLSCLFFV